MHQANICLILNNSSSIFYVISILAIRFYTRVKEIDKEAEEVRRFLLGIIASFCLVEKDES